MQPEVEARQQHRILQKEYGSFYRAVSDSLFRHNPMDLDGKRNTGEYDPEMGYLHRPVALIGLPDFRGC
jgi:hypothetical protein